MENTLLETPQIPDVSNLLAAEEIHGFINSPSFIKLNYGEKISSLKRFLENERVKVGFDIPVFNHQAEAYENWDSKQAEKIVSKLNAEIGQVEMAAILPTVPEKIIAVSDVARYTKLLALATEKGHTDDIAYFSEKLAAAQTKENPAKAVREELIALTKQPLTTTTRNPEKPSAAQFKATYKPPTPKLYRVDSITSGIRI